MNKLVGLIGIVLLIVWLAVRIVAGISYDRNCEGYLKQAADANTVPIALVQLQKAVDYAKASGWTEGYTSVIYTTPDEDVGYWYKNLSASLDGLKAVKADASQLEKSNVLMKLRETLTDPGKDGGINVTAPDGISIYPHNFGFIMLGFIAFFLALFFGDVWYFILYIIIVYYRAVFD